MNTRDLTLSALVAATIYISSQLSFPLPFSPIPITLQTFAIFLFSLIFPPRIAITGILVYLTLGLIGLPVFAGGNGGIAILLGPKGGYLLGYLMATVACSFLARYWSSSNLLRNLLICTAGMVIIYALGLTGLMMVTSVPLDKALVLGLYPFIPGDLVKLGLASTLALTVGRRIAHQFAQYPS
ncbi:biotin transporter BioY [Heliobacillus mobilis]|uniref:Biotin transporter n=1 Tax=Heliobacterium mobile TaxID=28064 RepID=A0A6I3SMQ6_HELMO|nr:biotin transporter BioY [Heliobacterium mobile]MTV50274.1 biotin transporter BioY [Heliobacterium mobile]